MAIWLECGMNYKYFIPAYLRWGDHYCTFSFFISGFSRNSIIYIQALLKADSFSSTSRARSICLNYIHSPKSLATFDGKIVDPEIAVKLEISDVLKVHGAQT